MTIKTVTTQVCDVCHKSQEVEGIRRFFSDETLELRNRSDALGTAVYDMCVECRERLDLVFLNPLTAVRPSRENPEETPKPKPNMYKIAVDIQDASNLTAIIKTWGELQSQVRADCPNGNHEVNRHPVNILFMSKVASLMRVHTDPIGSIEESTELGGIRDLFSAAYQTAKDKA